jgi:hypothetical protein
VGENEGGREARAFDSLVARGLYDFRSGAGENLQTGAAITRVNYAPIFCASKVIEI